MAGGKTPTVYHKPSVQVNRPSSVLATAVQYVPGVGPHRAELLGRLGIATLEDLWWHLPRRHEDRSRFLPIAKLVAEQAQTVKGRIQAVGARRSRRGLAIVEIAGDDGSAVLRALWFNQPYLRRRFRVGAEVILYGKVEDARPRQMVMPEFELVEAGQDDSLHLGRLVPIYPLVQAWTQRPFRAIVHHALERFVPQVVDPLPTALRAKHRLLDLRAALRASHFPKTVEMIARARRRLVFDEFLLLQLALALRRRQVDEERKPMRYAREGRLIAAFRERLPFALTAAQQRVIREILADLERSRPMHRLLHGDVGSGKTVVAAWAALVAVQSGYQVAFMAPTEILAEQHVRTLRAWLEPLGVRLAVLSGGRPAAARRATLAAIAAGEADVIVGTHALIQRGVVFAHLGLAVIDEQHKFGVVQRAALRQKGYAPDVLVMTATPIPRTLAMAVYGDLDISTLDELPPGRRPVRTVWVGESQRSEVYARVRDALRAGTQAYVVYPLIDSSSATDLKTATEMAKHLQVDIFPEFAVGLLHGRMASAEKDEVMRGFREGRIQLLVSTIVIEVGIDVSNATLMLVEHAERFGLAQLHQLRGRIGRGGQESTCIVLSDGGAEARARLEALVSTTNGFTLAERDLELRGPGELFGTRQHGLPPLQVGNLLTDGAVLQEAKAAAAALVAADPHLARPELRGLGEQLRRKVSDLAVMLGKTA